MNRLSDYRIAGPDGNEALATAPSQEEQLRARRREVFAELAEFRQSLLPQPPLTDEEILSMRDEGRRY